MSLNIVLRVGGTSFLIDATNPNVIRGRSRSMAKGQKATATYRRLSLLVTKT